MCEVFVKTNILCRSWKYWRTAEQLKLVDTKKNMVWCQPWMKQTWWSTSEEKVHVLTTKSGVKFCEAACRLWRVQRRLWRRVWEAAASFTGAVWEKVSLRSVSPTSLELLDEDQCFHLCLQSCSGLRGDLFSVSLIYFLQTRWWIRSHFSLEDTSSSSSSSLLTQLSIAVSDIRTEEVNTTR